ncbi:hypothetical protein [Algoriphagus sp. A40]|uniref:hypothetical protein n=1 Tax=Algoriphagus sp. A40 TaxID=1945863 RepID=UPI0009C7680E|nr:hypothetical protein [Algoriphagus sp. A40]OOG69902.1 hypothetical protein B0E43_19800 [Algoriphagus sp. A40]
MKDFLLKSFLWLGLGIAFILGYGTFCDYFFQQKQYLDLSEKKQWVLAQQGGSYDYAVLGSSRAYGAFDMNLLDSLTGWNGINLGSNGSGFKDNYLVLSLFLKSNKVKRLFLQVDMGTLNSRSSFSNEFHAFTFMPYWVVPEVREVLMEEIPLLGNPISSMAPQWRYFYFNKYFSPKEVLRRLKLSETKLDPYTKSKGGISAGNAEKQGEIETYELPKTEDPEDWHYLIKIKTKAEAAGIQVVFFTSPRYSDHQEELKRLLLSLPNTKIFPDEFDFSDPGLFQDQGHLSKEGREKFTIDFQTNLN